MFSWCSYCQNLIGEVEPLGDYRVSHGICVTCSQDMERHTESDLLRARAIFHMLVNAGRDGDLESCEQVIGEALDFGLKPSDILVGVLHPVLYRIGELWERGEISIAQEHRFTAFAMGFIDRLQVAEPASEGPLILLANHPENILDVGLRMLQFISWEEGVRCERLPTKTPEEELLSAASTRSPELFGLSVGLVEMIPAAMTLADSIARRFPDTSSLVLGGQAFRRSEAHQFSSPFTVIKSIDEFHAQLKSIKTQHAAANLDGIAGTVDPPQSPTRH